MTSLEFTGFPVLDDGDHGPVKPKSENACRSICIRPVLQESAAWFKVQLSFSQAWNFVLKPRWGQLEACTQVLPDPEMFLNMRKARMSLSSASKIEKGGFTSWFSYFASP